MLRNSAPSRVLSLILALSCALSLTRAAAATAFLRGDTVRLTRGETLLFRGKSLQSATKGTEFSVLKHDPAQRLVYVAYLQKDDTLVAATVPDEAVEASSGDGWADLLAGAEAFRDQRYADARRLLARAAQQEKTRTLAAGIATRVNAAAAFASRAREGNLSAQQALTNSLQGLRELAVQSAGEGRLSIAAALDEGANQLAKLLPAAAAAGALPASKFDRADVARRSATAGRALLRARQAAGMQRLVAASKAIEEGLAAEPDRAGLKQLEARIKRDLEDAEDNYRHAMKMRTRGPKGVLHALSALADGLKRCADHPQLQELKQEMLVAFEERTAPPVTPAFLSAAGKGMNPQALEEGHRLYTNRCTECHELELLDSRSVTGWQRTVAGMARRANLSGQEQERVIAYITAAQAGMTDPQ